MTAARSAAILRPPSALILVARGGAATVTTAAADGLAVHDVWARTTPPGATVGAVYLTASSAADDALVGADVDPSIAASAMLHSTDEDDAGRPR